jgi:hypothetical protein
MLESKTIPRLKLQRLLPLLPKLLVAGSDAAAEGGDAPADGAVPGAE